MQRASSLFAMLAVALAGPPALAQTISSRTPVSSGYPGIRIEKLQITNPTNNAWVAFVDLCTEYVHVDATRTPTSLQSAGAWAAGAGAQLATNGDFYLTGPVRVYGAAVGGGTPWPLDQTGRDPAYASEWFYGNYGWIAFGRNWVEFSHTEAVKKDAAALGVTQGWRPTTVTHDLPAGTLALVSGFPELVTEGTPYACGADPTAASCFPDRGDMRARHPRTAMGLTEDRRTFILLVVDGRDSPTSVGVYGVELAKLMHALGAWQAFNLDGGGSSQMSLRKSDGTYGYLNNVVANNLGNPARAVANHWGIFAGSANGKAKTPGHCVDNLNEGVLAAAMRDATLRSDIDGDGKSDACIRSATGIKCARGASFGTQLTGPALTDASGWDDLSNYSTVRIGDVDGDGKDDLCARGNSGVSCWRSTGSGFSATAIAGPALTDAAGWSSPAYGSTLRLADFDGDGKDDLCGRASNGFRCYPSTGTGFGAAVTSAGFTDTHGYTTVDKFATLRMGDVDGDGKADVCGRAASGMECYLSDGNGFPRRVVGPSWSDAAGWDEVRYWSTIRLADFNGDGKDDLCGRASSGFLCAPSLGTTFGAAVALSSLSDGSGWGDPANYGTIRMGDIDGDGDEDLCARANADLRCWKWTGSAFGPSVQGPALSDAAGWSHVGYYATLRLADLNGDGKSDLCARSATRLQCWLSDGAGFPTAVNGPAWAGAGWETPGVWGTLMLGRPRPPASSPDAGQPPPDAGQARPDAGVEEADAGEPDAGGTDEPDAGSDGDPGASQDAGAGAGGEDPMSVGGGCSCSSASGPASLLLAVALALAAQALGRRRRLGA